MIEAEHPRVEAAVRAGEIRRKRPLTRRGRQIVLGEQRILVAFPAEDLQRVTSLFEGRAHAHGAVLMQEVERRIGRDAEKQVFDARHRGGFSGLVITQHHLDIRCTRRQGDECVGEVTVAEQIKLSDTHDYTFSTARRATR